MASAARVICFLALSGATMLSAAETPSSALLVLEKADGAMLIVDPGSLKIVSRIPVGEDPHEVEVSDNGKFAYVSN